MLSTHPDISSGLGANQVSLVEYKVCMSKHDHGKGGVGSMQSPPSPTTMLAMVISHILNTNFLLLEKCPWCYVTKHWPQVHPVRVATSGLNISEINIKQSHNYLSTILFTRIR